MLVCIEFCLLISLSFCFYPATGNQILSLGTLSKDEIYPMKLKGISICYSALKSALCGNYVSFGVFKLYGDNHFDNVLQAFVKMLLSVSHSDLLVSTAVPWGLHVRCEVPAPQAWNCCSEAQGSKCHYICQLWI